MPAHETEEGFPAMECFYRIGVVHQFYSPVHVACREPRRCKCQHSLQYGDRIQPYADHRLFQGHPNVKRAADFTLMRKIGRPFFILCDFPRCRGPPPSKFQKI